MTICPNVEEIGNVLNGAWMSALHMKIKSIIYEFEFKFGQVSIKIK